MQTPEWYIELLMLAEKLPEAGVVYDLESMSNDDRYSLLSYLRNLQRERDHG